MATVDEVLAQLGEDVTPELLRSWHRRYGLHRAKLDGEWWYHLEGAIETEFLTSESGRGRPRGPATTTDTTRPAPKKET